MPVGQAKPPAITTRPRASGDETVPRIKDDVSFGKVDVDELRIKGYDLWEELQHLKREFEQLKQQQQSQRQPPSERHECYTSSRADLAEWMERLDHAEQVCCGDIVQVRGERMTKAISDEPGGTLFVVSSAPALAFNTPTDPARRACGAEVAFLGRVPVYCVGEAPINTYLVPSGRNDGSARAVKWAKLEGDAKLRARCIGVVWATLPPDAEGRSKVLAFVAAHPTQSFASLRNIERVAPLGHDLVPCAPSTGARTLAARPYQEEAIAKGVKANTIVCLETGLGKTLIAVRLIDQLLDAPAANATDKKKALFIVPTVVLVEQQARVCREYCARSRRVSELCGVRLSGWTRPNWERCLTESDVLVGTPEIFSWAFVSSGYLSLDNFALIIFDEVHNAVGKSPMASIMYDAYHPVRQADPSAPTPRIVGLTASFASGRLTNLDTQRQQLETLLDATIHLPDVPEQYRVEPRFSRARTWATDTLAGYESLAREKVDLLLSEFDGMPTKVKDISKLVQRCGHVLTECGMAGFTFYLGESLVYQLEGIANKLADLEDAVCRKKAQQLCSSLPQLRVKLREAACALQADGELTRAPFIAAKCSRLLELLRGMFERRRNSPRYKGIIFVEQVALTFPLAHVINQHHIDHPSQCIRAAAISGVGAMTSSMRSAVLDDFKRGCSSVLVATTALEEGIDVSDCQFVIRYSKFHTTKSHVQGAGRARHAEAEVVYFENEPHEELAKAEKMAQCAQDWSLSLSEAERHERVKVRVIDGFYPYRHATADGVGGTVNIYNSVQIFLNYCGKVLGQSLNLTDTSQICVYRTEVIRTTPEPLTRRVLDAVHYPSPAGYITVRRRLVNEHWGSVGIGDVLVPGRKLNGADDEERHRFFYTVVIDMHRRGYLTADNQPSAAARSETKAAIKGIPLPEAVALRDTFAPDALDTPLPQPPSPPSPPSPPLPPSPPPSTPRPAPAPALMSPLTSCRLSRSSSSMGCQRSSRPSTDDRRLDLRQLRASDTFSATEPRPRAGSASSKTSVKRYARQPRTKVETGGLVCGRAPSMSTTKRNLRVGASNSAKPGAEPSSLTSRSACSAA